MYIIGQWDARNNREKTTLIKREPILPHLTLPRTVGPIVVWCSPRLWQCLVQLHILQRERDEECSYQIIFTHTSNTKPICCKKMAFKKVYQWGCHSQGDRSCPVGQRGSPVVEMYIHTLDLLTHWPTTTPGTSLIRTPMGQKKVPHISEVSFLQRLK